MKAWNVTVEQLQSAAAAVNLRLNGPRKDGRALRFTLRTLGPKPPWRRLHRFGGGGTLGGPVVYRTVPGRVCWHGHRAFMRALYALAPTAKVQTTLATYTSLGQFERTHGATFGEGNGWNLQATYDNPYYVCVCEQQEEA